MSEYDAAIRLAEQLNDVPELAAMLREWAQGEQQRTSSKTKQLGASQG
jgi:hypothetical protein